MVTAQKDAFRSSRGVRLPSECVGDSRLVCDDNALWWESTKVPPKVLQAEQQ